MEKPNSKIPLDFSIYTERFCFLMGWYLLDQSMSSGMQLTPLPIDVINAIKEDDLGEYLKTFMESKDICSCVDEENNTVAHIAASLGKSESLKLLKPKLKDFVGLRNKHGRTPLHEAAYRRSDNEVIDILLENGAQINDKEQGTGNTPLHLAIQEKHDTLSKLLLDCKADPNIQNAQGNTCLHEAILTKNLDIVKQICEAGGDLHIKNENGKTVLATKKPNKIVCYLRDVNKRRKCENKRKSNEKGKEAKRRRTKSNEYMPEAQTSFRRDIQLSTPQSVTSSECSFISHEESSSFLEPDGDHTTEIRPDTSGPTYLPLQSVCSTMNNPIQNVEQVSHISDRAVVTTVGPTMYHEQYLEVPSSNSGHVDNVDTLRQMIALISHREQGTPILSTPAVSKEEKIVIQVALYLLQTGKIPFCDLLCRMLKK